MSTHSTPGRSAAGASACPSDHRTGTGLVTHPGTAPEPGRREARGGRARYSDKGPHSLHVRFQRLLSVLALAALGSLPLTATPVFADDDLQPGQSAVVSGTDGRGLRVRGGPGMTHRILTTVAEGTSVQVVAGPVSDGDDDWYQISVGPSTTGWGIGRYLVPATAIRALSLETGERTFLARVTAYADGTGGIPLNARTYSGTRTRWGVVAVDPKFIPLGSLLTIEGYEDTIFIAEDTGSGLKGAQIDLWHPSSKDAKQYGTQYRRVTILREGPAR